MIAYLAIIKDGFREALASKVLWILLVVITFVLLSLAPFGYVANLTTGIKAADVLDWQLFAASLVRANERAEVDEKGAANDEGEAVGEGESGDEAEGTLSSESDDTRQSNDTSGTSDTSETSDTSGTSDGVESNDGDEAEPPVEQKEKSPARRIWNHLSGSARQKMAAFADGQLDGEKKQAAIQQCTLDLKKMLNDEHFFDRETWKRVKLVHEAREIVVNDERSESETKRLNRLALESAFPGLIRSSERSTLKFCWAHFDLPMGKFPIRIELFHRVIARFLDATIHWVFGPIGIFIGVLVTAPIVPRTFESGTLHLLLSKPISRSFVLVAKFLGGCAFVFICSAYLLTGLWLIVGLRFGYWYPGMLWYIPAFVFVFAIYYVVSVWAGLIWKNTIVSIAVSIMFWGFCAMLGTAKVQMEEFLLTEEIDRIVPAGEATFVVKKNVKPAIWEDGDWQLVFLTKEQDQMDAFARQFAFVGPVYDPGAKRIYAAQEVIDPGVNPIKAWMNDQVIPTTVHLNVGEQSQGWKHRQGVSLPNGVIELGRGVDGQLLLVTSVGIFRLAGDPLRPRQDTNLFGFNLKLSSGPFKRLTSTDWPAASPPWDAAISGTDLSVVLATRGNVYRFAVNEKGQYRLAGEYGLVEKTAEKTVEKTQKCLVASGGRTVALVDEKGWLHLLEAGTLEERLRIQPTGSATSPRAITISEDGRWTAVLFHNREVVVIDNKTDEVVPAGIRGQGDVSAVAFSVDSRLYVADRTNRVTIYSLEPFEQVKELSPTLSTLDKIYRYGIAPAHYCLPKPGELNRTVKYLVTGDESEALEGEENASGITAIHKKLNPWRPIWSGLAFIGVVLGIACFYFERREL